LSLKCIHIADVHFRGLTRHDEYRETFTRFFEKARELCPDVIYVGGDIVHSKTQGISPELIDMLSWWFTSLADVAPTHIILGNHDGLIQNKDRQDAITPILSALNNPRLHLYKDSGTYPIGVPGFNWCVFSCFDEEGWSSVEPIEGEVNIALFHGGVNGSVTDINWNIEGDVDLDFFDPYEFTFLGDIHKSQFLDPSKTVAYCGSTIQQNYGEDERKGFLFWDIRGKDDFDVTFHKVPHHMPFVTIPWMGDISSTLEGAKGTPRGARYRIRSEEGIPQAEIRHLHTALKEIKGAAEIVFKYDHDINVDVIQTDDGMFRKEDLRDTKTHVKLLREYYKEDDLSDEEWNNLEDLSSRYVGLIAHDDSPRNTKWSIKRMEFDNMFAYGKGNVINFDELRGITGLFGRNRTGKSSIPGALMYGLFNTTDRGPIKNLHVINSRKGHCLTRLDININGRNYRIERQSVKHQNRKGKVNATTHLNLFLLDANGEVLQDLSEEQRRETEKIVRRLIGTADDFLLTSLAGQGEMNAFIKHRATQRKSILTNFLDLNIFDKMHEMAKTESSEIKGVLKNVPDRDWNTVISEKRVLLDKKTTHRDRVESQLAKIRRQVQELSISLATHKDKDLVTEADIELQNEKITSTNKDLTSSHNRIKLVKDQIEEIKNRLEKIDIVKAQFPIDVLKERLEAQQDLEKFLVDIRHQHEKERSTLKMQEKSIKKLQEVPCGDEFPTCKFIKDSHKHKKLVTEQIEKTSSLLDQVRAAQTSLKSFRKEDLEDKIHKYDSVLHQESALKIDMSKKTVIQHELRSTINSLSDYLEEAENYLRDMRLRVSNSKQADEVCRLRKEMSDLNKKTNQLDASRMSLSETVGLLTSEISVLQEERIKYKDLLMQWKTYDLFLAAVSKKGIPLRIITSQLPAINAEVAKILQGVVGFTVELEADAGTNAMDIYIDYGDSRRIIECASGMEKMVSSLAIRVALINISSLPKTDMLIIDEGFGALDEINIEACNRLLASLKKWFKNILVISHVDAVKDAVDNVLDITKKGKDAMVKFDG